MASIAEAFEAPALRFLEKQAAVAAIEVTASEMDAIRLQTEMMTLRREALASGALRLELADAATAVAVGDLATTRLQLHRLTDALDNMEDARRFTEHVDFVEQYRACRAALQQRGHVTARTLAAWSEPQRLAAYVHDVDERWDLVAFGRADGSEREAEDALVYRQTVNRRRIRGTTVFYPVATAREQWLERVLPTPTVAEEEEEDATTTATLDNRFTDLFSWGQRKAEGLFATDDVFTVVNGVVGKSQETYTPCIAMGDYGYWPWSPDVDTLRLVRNNQSASSSSSVDAAGALDRKATMRTVVDLCKATGGTAAATEGAVIATALRLFKSQLVAAAGMRLPTRDQQSRAVAAITEFRRRLFPVAGADDFWRNVSTASKQDDYPWPAAPREWQASKLARPSFEVFKRLAIAGSKEYYLKFALCTLDNAYWWSDRDAPNVKDPAAFKKQDERVLAALMTLTWVRNACYGENMILDISHLADANFYAQIRPDDVLRPYDLEAILYPTGGSDPGSEEQRRIPGWAASPLKRFRPPMSTSGNTMGRLFSWLPGAITPIGSSSRLGSTLKFGTTAVAMTILAMALPYVADVSVNALPWAIVHALSPLLMAVPGLVEITRAVGGGGGGDANAVGPMMHELKRTLASAIGANATVSPEDSVAAAAKATQPAMDRAIDSATADVNAKLGQITAAANALATADTADASTIFPAGESIINGLVRAGSHMFEGHTDTNIIRQALSTLGPAQPFDKAGTMLTAADIHDRVALAKQALAEMANRMTLASNMRLADPDGSLRLVAARAMVSGFLPGVCDDPTLAREVTPLACKHVKFQIENMDVYRPINGNSSSTNNGERLVSSHVTGVPANMSITGEDGLLAALERADATGVTTTESLWEWGMKKVFGTSEAEIIDTGPRSLVASAVARNVAIDKARATNGTPPPVYITRQSLTCPLPDVAPAAAVHGKINNPGALDVEYETLVRFKLKGDPAGIVTDIVKQPVTLLAAAPRARAAIADDHRRRLANLADAPLESLIDGNAKALLAKWLPHTEGPSQRELAEALNTRQHAVTAAVTFGQILALTNLGLSAVTLFFDQSSQRSRKADGLSSQNPSSRVTKRDAPGFFRSLHRMVSESNLDPLVGVQAVLLTNRAWSGIYTWYTGDLTGSTEFYVGLGLISTALLYLDKWTGKALRTYVVGRLQYLIKQRDHNQGRGTAPTPWGWLGAIGGVGIFLSVASARWFLRSTLMLPKADSGPVLSIFRGALGTLQMHASEAWFTWLQKILTDVNDRLGGSIVASATLVFVGALALFAFIGVGRKKKSWTTTAITGLAYGLLAILAARLPMVAYLTLRDMNNASAAYTDLRKKAGKDAWRPSLFRAFRYIVIAAKMSVRLLLADAWWIVLLEFIDPFVEFVMKAAADSDEEWKGTFVRTAYAMTLPSRGSAEVINQLVHQGHVLEVDGQQTDVLTFNPATRAALLTAVAGGAATLTKQRRPRTHFMSLPASAAADDDLRRMSQIPVNTPAMSSDSNTSPLARVLARQLPKLARDIAFMARLTADRQ
jgi:hypothetical protein